MRRRGAFAGRQRPSLLGTMARTAVVAGTASAVAGGVRARQDQRRHDQQQRAEPPPAPAPAAGGDLADTIARLAQLRDSGALTDDEFAAAKARLLTGN
jgi:putative oligomerization/nucleic acid binding protein